jgi:hypothetical protein
MNKWLDSLVFSLWVKKKKKKDRVKIDIQLQKAVRKKSGKIFSPFRATNGQVTALLDRLLTGGLVNDPIMTSQQL